MFVHADIRTALKGKDEDYVKLLKRQAADVDTMLSAMGQQLGQMTAAYREELEAVERVLLQVRPQTVESGCLRSSAPLLETIDTISPTSNVGLPDVVAGRRPGHCVLRRSVLTCCPATARRWRRCWMCAQQQSRPSQTSTWQLLRTTRIT